MHSMPELMHTGIRDIYLAAAAGGQADAMLQACSVAVAADGLLFRQGSCSLAAGLCRSWTPEQFRGQLSPAGGSWSESHAVYCSLEAGDEGGWQMAMLRAASEPAFTGSQRKQLSWLGWHVAAALAAVPVSTGQQEPVSPPGEARLLADGRLLDADSTFNSLLHGVLPNWDGCSLPVRPTADTAEQPPQLYQHLVFRFTQEGSGWRVSLRRDRRALRMTEREFQIVQRICAGMTFKEVARELSVAPSTVSTHLYKVYNKLGVRKRSELMALVAARPTVQLTTGDMRVLQRS